MITMNDTLPSPKPLPTYRIRKEAMDAAVFAIGPHARHGFEYETSKVDGRWIWRPTDEIKLPTAAEIKASGGQRAFLDAACHGKARQGGAGQGKPWPGGCGEVAMPPHISLASTPMAHVEAAKPVKLPVPPRRMPRPARSEAAGAPDGGAGGGQPPSDDKPSSIVDSWEELPTCNGLDVAKPDDGLDLPTFLKREPAPAKSGTYDKMKASGALRSEPVAKPAGKPPVSRKVAKAKTAPKAKKSATKAPAKRAGVSGGKTNIGTVARTAILKGKSNEEALAAVMRAFPDCSSNLGCMAWYRNRLKRDGYFKQNGSPSVKGEALLAQAEAPGL